ncbi:Polyadenylate binding proteim [Spraguea lophii 42_110]|uniref:Polyadenylate binding proteim n=1 Tax=Spraguea lophii (strain 42_110) TaxID=1358809 RepID=S7W9Q2_SPRLO|nr:Polyadenylate binding proteim [Spraguea lophii 42_110]
MRIVATNVKNHEKLKDHLKNYGIITEFKIYSNKIIIGFSKEEDGIRAVNGTDKMYIENKRVNIKILKNINNDVINETKEEFKSDKFHKEYDLIRIINIMDLKDKLSLSEIEFKEQIKQCFSEFFKIIDITFSDEVILKVVRENSMNKKIIFCGRIVKYKKIININLFLTFSSVLNNVEDKISFIKDKDIGVKSTILETEIIQNNIKFLYENNIDINNISHINRKGLLVRNEIVIDGIKARVSTNGSLSLLYFTTEEECERNKIIIEQRCRYVEYMPVSKKNEKEEINIATNKLLIKNIPFQATKEEIKKLFSKFKIKGIRVPKNNEGRIRGFAFLEMENVDEARYVYEWYGKFTHLYGRRLIIEYSNN